MDLEHLIKECASQEYGVHDKRSLAILESDVRERIEALYRNAELVAKHGTKIELPIPHDDMMVILGETRRPRLQLPEMPLPKHPDGKRIPDEYVEKCRQLVRESLMHVRFPSI